VVAFLQVFASLHQQMNATLTRSDVLRALIWPMGILTTITLGLVIGKAPDWMLVAFSAMTVLSFLLYGAAYVFCLIKDRDCLRSETYSLHKMAIEHGVYGDSATGLIDPNTSAPQLTLPAEPPSEPEAK
jgi:hypothetical protein